MSEPGLARPAAQCPVPKRSRWLAWVVFTLFLLKGLAWLAVPALIAAGLLSD